MNVDKGAICTLVVMQAQPVRWWFNLNLHVYDAASEQEIRNVRVHQKHELSVAVARRSGILECL